MSVNVQTLKNIRAILPCVFFTTSDILKRKRVRAKSFVSAQCENEAGALSANHNAGLQCKINSANQGV